MEGQCPQCSAVLEIQDRAECSSCGTVVNSGEHDWVLAEITQVDEWNMPFSTRKTAGVAGLRRSDPHFSVQHLEDRASVMFYRIQATHFFQDEGYAKPILSSTISGLPRMAALPKSHIWRKPVIGKVETLSVRSLPEADCDEVRVLIIWSGSMCKRNSQGQLHLVKPHANYAHVYVLVRRKGVSSNSERTFASSSCSQCGGAIAVTKEQSCSFCGTVLTDGKHDWVLKDIERFTPQMAYQAVDQNSRHPLRIPQADTSLDPKLVLSILARVAAADGHVDQQELEALRRILAQSKMKDVDLEAIIQTAQQSDIDLPVPETVEEVRQFFRLVIHICLSDRRLTTPEKQMVFSAAKKLDYPIAEVKKLFTSEKKKLYREARRLRRKEKAENQTSTG